MEWLFAQEIYHELHADWVESEFVAEKRPSVDRLDDSRGYGFDNIQLMTWGENNKKGHVDRSRGNTTRSKAVVGTESSTGEAKEYISAGEASRQTNACRSSVANCCLGKPNFRSAGGYTWRYKNDT